MCPHCVLTFIMALPVLKCVVGYLRRLKYERHGRSVHRHF